MARRPPARLLRAADSLAPREEPSPPQRGPLYGLRSSGLPESRRSHCVDLTTASIPRLRPTPESYQQSDEGSHHSGEELSLHVRPGASVLYVRATRTSLLRAVRTRSAGQLALKRHALYVRHEGYQPRPCRTYRVPWQPRRGVYTARARVRAPQRAHPLRPLLHRPARLGRHQQARLACGRGCVCQPLRPHPHPTPPPTVCHAALP